MLPMERTLARSDASYVACDSHPKPAHSLSPTLSYAPLPFSSFRFQEEESIRVRSSSSHSYYITITSILLLLHALRRGARVF